MITIYKVRNLLSMMLRDPLFSLLYLRSYFMSILRLNSAFIISNIHGLKLYHKPEDIFILKEILNDMKYMKFKPQKGWVVVDIGAHIGSYTLLCAKNADIVVAVEPEPQNLMVLKNNIKLNDFRNVIVVPLAISNSCFRTKLYRSNKKTDAHSIKLEQRNVSKLTGNPIIVNCIDLDTLKSKLRLPKIDLIKIDAEGAEAEILEGGKQTLKDVKYVIIEVHSETVIQKAIENLLKDLDFKVVKVNKENPRYPIIFATKCFR
jgi:FkbM family methyltransferase